MAIRFLDEDPVKQQEQELVQKAQAGTLTGQELAGFRQAQSEQVIFDPQRETQQAVLQAQQQEAPIQSAIFPRLTEAQAGVRGGEAVSTGLDLLSLPGRALASLLGREEDESFVQSLAQKEGEGFIGDIVRDPATGAAVLTLPLAGVGGLGLKGVAGVSAGEGLLGAGVTQAERLTLGEEFQPGQVALETGISAAIPGIGKGISVALKKAVNPTLAKMTQELSGVSQDALRKFGFGFGKGAKELKAASESAVEIGDNILNAIDNFDEFIPEKAIIDDALTRMPDMSTKKAKNIIMDKINSLGDLPNELKAKNKLIDFFEGIDDPKKIAETVIGGKQDIIQKKLTRDPITGKLRTTSVKKQVSDKLKRVKATQRKIDIGTGLKKEDVKISAKDFRGLRSRLDKSIDFREEGADIVNETLKKARGSIASDLVNIANETGEKDFSIAMKIWSKKLQTKDKLTRLLGKTGVAREERVESFVNNLFSKNKTNRQSIIKQIDDILGESFSEDAKLLKLSSELGEGGVARIFPSSFTGRSLLGVGVGGAVGGTPGAIVGTALSSPRIGAATLSLADLAQRGAERGGQFIQKRGVSAPLGLLGREAVGE